jgi:hypothetical protein
MTMNFNYMAEPRSSGFRSRESGFTPAQDWARFKSEVQPFWARRAPMGDIGGQLGAQYMLSAPSLARTAQGDRPTFAQFITGTGGQPYGPASFSPQWAGSMQQMRQLAQEAASAGAAMDPGRYIEQGATAPEMARRAWYTSQFGVNAPLGLENQMLIANRLAQQSPTGRMYTGGLSQAIQGTLGDMYQKRLNRGAAKNTFLDWYLSQTE